MVQGHIKCLSLWCSCFTPEVLTMKTLILSVVLKKRNALSNWSHKTECPGHKSLYDIYTVLHILKIHNIIPLRGFNHEVVDFGGYYEFRNVNCTWIQIWHKIHSVSSWHIFCIRCISPPTLQNKIKCKS